VPLDAPVPSPVIVLEFTHRVRNRTSAPPTSSSDRNRRRVEEHNRLHVGLVRHKNAPPDRTILIPGVITQTTNLVEHPELIAERIVRFARIVGRENVIAGADCGFAASGIRFNDTHPSVAWLKFAAMAQGARLASQDARKWNSGTWADGATA
jgi:hypothetical protein